MPRYTDPTDLPAEMTAYAIRDLDALQRKATAHGEHVGAYAGRGTNWNSASFTVTRERRWPIAFPGCGQVGRLLAVQDPPARRFVGDPEEQRHEEVAATRLRLGDVIEVRSGEVVPADSRVMAHVSYGQGGAPIETDGGVRTRPRAPSQAFGTRPSTADGMDTRMSRAYACIGDGHACDNSLGGHEQGISVYR